MKAIFIAIVALCFVLPLCCFVSCSAPVFTIITNNPETQDIDITFQDVDSAWKWVAENIEYKADPYGGWKKLPEETYRDRMVIIVTGKQIGRAHV